MKFAILVLLGLAGIVLAQPFEIEDEEYVAPGDPDFDLENFYKEPKSHEDAANSCEALNRRLLYPGNKKQVEQVIRFMRDKKLPSIWIGVNRPPGGEPPYQWRVHKRPLVDLDTALFRSGEPNNMGGNEFCVEVRDEKDDSPGQRLNDLPCDLKRPYFCVTD